MFSQIEHFVYGTREQLKRFCADLPAGIEVVQVPGGLVLREVLEEGNDVDAAIATIAARAGAHGVIYDGHGQFLNYATRDGSKGLARDLQMQTFTSRTGIKAGHGFAFALPNGCFGHAIHIGSDRRGYLLLDIIALVADRPANCEALRDAPRRYRQPILVWHTPFTILPLAGTRPLAQTPCAVAFRNNIGWPDPQEITRLESQFGISETDSPAGWNALLFALAEANVRLTDRHEYNVWTARVGRSGLLKLIEDHAVHPFLQTGDRPMPWDPVDIGEIMASLMGAPDMTSIRDKVT